MFYKEEMYEYILPLVELVNFSKGYRLNDFDCSSEDYNSFLLNDAEQYINENISKIKLLINKQNGDIISYMALSTDSFLLDSEEKSKEGLDIPFNSVPAVKIGKLATDKKYKDLPYGSFMLWLSLGFLEKINELGVGCRCIIVDADITERPDTPEFYLKNGFEFNEKENKKRTRSLSMRFDAF
ncbi:hypothetical protein CEB3_c03710 [Peptococcaceae bacterium CEB3]|nr:hypothetical protein CEB3_c03710 [Peptococcaceae bacterium CEB3]